MAKPFYSLEEVTSKLGKSADEVKALVRDGALREFRDAGKVFFKAEDVDKLITGPASRAGDSGEILLEPADEALSLDDSLPSLIDSSAGTSIIGLEAAPDEDRPRRGDTVVPRGGMRVFEDDELPTESDPLGKTSISAVDDQVMLDSSGSASGLMDIAREADDTSLGAELLDEIYPGEEDAVEAGMKTAAPLARDSGGSDTGLTQAESDADEADDSGGEILTPVLVSTGDPSEGMFAGLLVGALLVIALGSSVVAAVLQGFLPDYARFLTQGSNYWFFLGGSVGAVGLALLIGWFVGRASAGPRRR